MHLIIGGLLMFNVHFSHTRFVIDKFILLSVHKIVLCVIKVFLLLHIWQNTTQSSLQAELRSIRQELLLNWCFLCKCCFHAFSHTSFESINKQASSSPQSQHVEHAKLFIPSASIRPFSWASLITLCLFSTLGTVFLLKITIGLNFDPSPAHGNKTVAWH